MVDKAGVGGQKWISQKWLSNETNNKYQAPVKHLHLNWCCKFLLTYQFRNQQLIGFVQSNAIHKIIIAWIKSVHSISETHWIFQHGLDLKSRNTFLAPSKLLLDICEHKKAIAYHFNISSHKYHRCLVQRLRMKWDQGINILTPSDPQWPSDNVSDPKSVMQCGAFINWSIFPKIFTKDTP